MNAVEAFILRGMTTEESASWLAELNTPPRPPVVSRPGRAQRPRAGPPGGAGRPRRRAMTRAEAEATQANADAYDKGITRRR